MTTFGTLDEPPKIQKHSVKVTTPKGQTQDALTAIQRADILTKPQHHSILHDNLTQRPPLKDSLALTVTQVKYASQYAADFFKETPLTFMFNSASGAGSYLGGTFLITNYIVDNKLSYELANKILPDSVVTNNPILISALMAGGAAGLVLGSRLPKNKAELLQFGTAIGKAFDKVTNISTIYNVWSGNTPLTEFLSDLSKPFSKPSKELDNAYDLLPIKDILQNPNAKFRYVTTDTNVLGTLTSKSTRVDITPTILEKCETLDRETYSKLYLKLTSSRP